MSTTPKYKLMYANTRGRAESIRMLFALKGLEFEDYRFKEGEWQQIKNDKTLFPFGQIPVLLINGKSMPQGRAIMRHLGREFGFYGANNAEADQIDIVCETIDDIVPKVVPIAFEQDQEKKKKLVEDFRDNSSKPYLPYLNELIEKAGGRFFVGNSESIADINTYCILEFVYGVLDSARETYPALAKFFDGITENSRLSEYIKNRPPLTK
nr:S-crystallin SL11-like [Lytechinus pictus]